jgi:hypothetical protein
VNQVPLWLQNKMHSLGVVIRVCPDVAKLHLQRLKQTANVAGTYEYWFGVVYIGAQVTNAKGETQNATYLAWTARHEVGHVFNHIYGIQGEAGFREAITADWEKLAKSPAQLRQLEHFVQQRTPEGANEACAEAFAAATLPAGDKRYGLQPDLFMKNFPNTIKYVQKRLNEIAVQEAKANGPRLGPAPPAPNSR